MNITLSESWTGLCNQLFALVTGILQAKRFGHTKVRVGTFSPEIKSKQRIPITKIIDLATTGKRVGVDLVAGTDRGRSCFGWYNRYHEQTFVMILRSIQFQPVFYTIAQELFDAQIDSARPLHVVHFRIEQDGINHWSRMNKMSADVFRGKLHSRYSKLIAENIPKGSQILALTYDTTNALLQELGKEYTIVSLDTEGIVKKRIGHGGRELCAIVDLLVGVKCTGVFIGCHNLTLKRGSTFSYTLWRLMNNIKGVFIDLDDLK